jgi:hypothetical protein
MPVWTGSVIEIAMDDRVQYDLRGHCEKKSEDQAIGCVMRSFRSKEFVPE